MKDEKKAPKLRFKGFTDDWEQCKAKELFESKSKKDHNDLPVLSATQENGIVFRNDLDIDIKFDTHALSNYKVVSPGDYIISLRSFQGGFELSEKRGIISPAYTVFAFNNQEKNRQNNTFWKYLFKRYDFIESLKRLTFGIRDGKAISFNQFSTLKLSFPNFDEQNKIATLLHELDRTITLYEEKKRQLELLKSALLQKMFADKSGYPAVRFEGFDEMWEYCKLEEVFVERNQKGVADANYPLCSFIAHKGVVPKDKYDRSFLVKSDGKKYKRTELNDFIYSSNNLETGSIGLNKFGRATISPVYSIFMVKGDSDFIAGLASTPRFIYEMIRFRQGVVYGQWRIHESDFLKIKYYIPQVTEQEKIGNLLSKLTRAIILHDRKLKLLLSVKQSLLQKMFI